MKTTRWANGSKKPAAMRRKGSFRGQVKSEMRGIWYRRYAQGKLSQRYYERLKQKHQNGV